MMATETQEIISTQQSVFDVRRLSGTIGAEISGVKLSSELSDDDYKTLYQHLLKYKVLFFRGQHHLDDAGQENFARLFGDLVPHPTEPALSGRSILELDASTGGGRADSWHTDVTFVPDYPKVCILRGVVVPEFGGDTVWANTAAAYEKLPDSLKNLVDGLWAIHDNEYDYAANRAVVSAEQLKHHREVFLSRKLSAEHPLVHVHPDTGERSLILGHFLRKINGFSQGESAKIFSILQDRAIRLENTVRWSWKTGDVAIWDNRATQHYAINDYGSQPRVMRRVTVNGVKPVSILGQHSTAVV